MNSGEESPDQQRAKHFKYLFAQAREERDRLRRDLAALAGEYRSLLDAVAGRMDLPQFLSPPSELADVEDPKTPGFDATLVSFPKSGRTWLSYLYYYYAVQFIEGGEAGEGEEAFTYRPEESARCVRALAVAKSFQSFPKIRFSHGAPGRGKVPYQDLIVSDEAFQGQPITLLVRDPRDVVVSYFHHVTNPDKGYEHGTEYSMSSFVRSDLFGIRYIIEHMNQWAALRSRAPEAIALLFYEDLVRDTQKTFRDFLFFMGADPVCRRWIDNAAARASFESLKSLETLHRLQSKASLSSNMMRMRRGEIGGFRTELDEADIAFVEEQIASFLHPSYGRYVGPAQG